MEFRVAAIDFRQARPPSATATMAKFFDEESR